MTTAKLIRLPAVLDKLGVSRATAYAWIKAGYFPAPIKIGPRASGWPLAEVEAWIAERVTARANDN